MKTSHLLVIAVSVAVGCGGLYTALTSQATPPVEPAPTMVLANSLPVNDHGGGTSVELASLRQELNQLRAELRNPASRRDRGQRLLKRILPARQRLPRRCHTPRQIWSV